MLFSKKIPRSCSYCVHATQLTEDSLLCAKRGMVSTDRSCRKFRYDPCKRIPPRPKAPEFSQYSEEDFKL